MEGNVEQIRECPSIFKHEIALPVWYTAHEVERKASM